MGWLDLPPECFPDCSLGHLNKSRVTSQFEMTWGLPWEGNQHSLGDFLSTCPYIFSGTLLCGQFLCSPSATSMQVARLDVEAHNLITRSIQSYACLLWSKIYWGQWSLFPASCVKDCSTLGHCIVYPEWWGSAKKGVSSGLSEKSNNIQKSISDILIHLYGS